jgi:sugar phosphate isomerase/epimerase
LAVDLDAEESQFASDLAGAAQQAQLAAEIGCTRCRLTLPPANDIRPYHESFELYRRRLGEVASALQPSGTRLGVGFVASAEARVQQAFQSVHTFDALLMLVKSVAADKVGVWLDVWQWHVSGGDIAHIKALTAGDVVCVDLSDATSDAGDDGAEPSSRLLPGHGSESGKIDSAAVLVILAEAGYDGPVTPVAHPNAFAGAKREQIVEKAGQALDDVWSAAGLSRHGKLVQSG